MYEYVITAGPGIMLYHGIATDDGPDVEALVKDDVIVMTAKAPSDAEPERFH